jgi:hypothetical protein
METISEVKYANGVVLHKRTAEGWPVTDVDGKHHTFASIPAFMAWCRVNYSWPMAA